MRFDEVWMPPHQLEALATLAQRTNDMPGDAIEIGAWQGLSTIAIANAIPSKYLHVVDHWKGSSDMPQEIRDRDNYTIFLNNMREGTASNYIVHKRPWREFADDWFDPISFIHLDAEHTASEVLDQIDWALPHISKGGIICGDDYNWLEVRKGIYKMFPRKTVNVRWFKLWWVTI